MTLKQELLSYYKENTEDFNHDIEELDDFNCYLGGRRYLSMEELDDLYEGYDPLALLRLAFYGYDDDDSTLDKKEPFNPNKDYFYLNGMRDLVSTDQQDYSDYLDDRFIEQIIENGSDHLTLSDGAQNIIDDYQEEKNEENKLEFKLTADEVGIDQNDGVGTLDLFYILVEDEAFEKLGEELFKAQMLEFSDENGNDPDEVEDWFFDNSKVIDWNAKAKMFYNPIIGRNDIKVELQETREATVNGVKFTVSASANKSETYNNGEAKKMVELKIW